MTSKQSKSSSLRGKAITYYPAIEESFDLWAEACGCEPNLLRHASETAIQTHHHEAVIAHDCHKAAGRQPNIYCLQMDYASVFYTIEAECVVIRGYWYFTRSKSLDHFEGGRIYHEATWSAEYVPKSKWQNWLLRRLWAVTNSLTILLHPCTCGAGRRNPALQSAQETASKPQENQVFITKT